MLPEFELELLPEFTINFFDKLNIVETKYFNTIKECAEYIGIDRFILAKGIYEMRIQKSTNIPYQISRNKNKYKLTIDGKSECFEKLKDISEITGIYYGILKGKLIKKY